MEITMSEGDLCLGVPFILSYKLFFCCCTCVKTTDLHIVYRTLEEIKTVSVTANPIKPINRIRPHEDLRDCQSIQTIDTLRLTVPVIFE